MKNPSLLSVFPFISIFEKKEDKEDNFKEEVLEEKRKKRRSGMPDLVLDDANEILLTQKKLGRILLKGDNISLIQQMQSIETHA